MVSMAGTGEVEEEMVESRLSLRKRFSMSNNAIKEFNSKEEIQVPKIREGGSRRSRITDIFIRLAHLRSLLNALPCTAASR